MASNQTSTEYGSCVSQWRGWREREGERERERVASEGNGVSFRGIDVSQYRPDAVDTPICNPRPQSLPSRNCVLKVRQGESYSSPSHGVSPPASRDFAFQPILAPRFLLSRLPPLLLFLHGCPFDIDKFEKRKIERGGKECKGTKQRENDEGAALSRSFIGLPFPPVCYWPRVSLLARGNGA